MLLILLCKYPESWKVKTRLWKSIWLQKAAEFQRKCIEKLIATHCSSKQYKCIIWLGGSDKSLDLFCDEFWVSRLQVFQQQWDDLWQIMSHALAYWHSITRTVCLIGSDVPVLSTQDVYTALRWLDHHDIVVGPSEDWWYYLIGAKWPIDDVLLWMTYSTPTVCEETLNRSKQYGYSTTILPSMIDIDTIEALHQAKDQDITRWIEDIADELQINMD